MRYILVGCLFFSSFIYSINLYAKTPTPVIIISIDAFARNYLDQYPTKNLHLLMKRGLTAKALLPIFPSKTFPNHLSIITGTYPIKHGIIHNHFYSRHLKQIYSPGRGEQNSNWVTASPVWTYAEQHNIKSAVYFWPESSAKVQGGSPTYNMSYNKKTPNIVRVNKIMDWLKLPKESRPQFIVGYFSLVDTAGHLYGRNSPELAAAVKEADRLIGVLYSRLTHEITQGFDLIVVSDHGMVNLQKNSRIKWQNIVAGYKNLKIINGQTQLLIYSKNKQALAAIAIKFKQHAKSQYRVYNKNNFPKKWHWNKTNERMPDLILDANVPFIFKSNGVDHNVATHGWNVDQSSNLNAIFIAVGRNFKSEKSINAFQNINVAPLLLHLLHINNVKGLDGNYSIFKPYLK